MARKEKNKKEVKGFSSFLNNQIDFTLLITILLLLSIGLIMVLSASAPSSLQKYGNSYKFLEKQINELELNYGYEDFMEVLLGKAKKVFALDKTHQARVLDVFKEKMISGNLPEPFQVHLRRKESITENNMSIEDHMKSLFPNIEIKED